MANKQQIFMDTKCEWLRARIEALGSPEIVEFKQVAVAAPQDWKFKALTTSINSMLAHVGYNKLKCPTRADGRWQVRPARGVKKYYVLYGRGEVTEESVSAMLERLAASPEIEGWSSSQIGFSAKNK